MRFEGTFQTEKGLDTGLGILSIDYIRFRYDQDSPFADIFAKYTEDSEEELFCDWDQSEWAYDPETGRCDFMCRAISFDNQYIETDREPWTTTEPWKYIHPSECKFEIPEAMDTDVTCRLTELTVYDPWDNNLCYDFSEKELQAVDNWECGY